MPLYDYEKTDQKIHVIELRIKQAVSGNVLLLFAKEAGQIPVSCEDRAEKLRQMASEATKEIKIYVTQIWNDNAERERLLEKLQDDLNQNIRYIKEQKIKLQSHLERQKGLSAQEKSLTDSIQTVLNRLNDIEGDLNKIYSAYAEASKKGWKIIFYPALGIKVIKYKIEKKDIILEEQRKIQKDNLDKLFREEYDLLEGERELKQDIDSCTEVIAEAETVLIMQKAELGEMKAALVKWTNAYIYYSMLGQTIDLTERQMDFEKDLCESVDRIAVTQKELERLLLLWEQNKNDSGAVYDILKRMFDAAKTESYGNDIGDDFDDSEYMRNRFEKIRGLHIQSGYIVDGIRILYKNEIDSELHGGKGGSGKYIIFDEGDELKRIEGAWGVPYMRPGGDAVGNLFIVTRKGKRYGPYGECGNRGRKFQIEIPENTSFVGFYGKQSQNSFLTKIGLAYIEIDQGYVY